MRAKKFLQKLRDLDKEIRYLSQRLEWLKSKSTSTNAGGLSHDNVRDNKRKDPVADVVVEMDTVKDALKKSKADRSALVKEAKELLGWMQNGTARDILHDRYVLCLSWEEIREARHYSKDYCFELHRKGLRELETMFPVKPT